MCLLEPAFLLSVLAVSVRCVCALCQSVANFLLFKRVPEWLSARIVEFYEYKVASSRSALQSARLDDLPRDLAMLLTIELHRELIQKSFVFQALPPSYVLALLRNLRPVVLTPGHICIHEGQPSVRPLAQTHPLA